MLGALDHDALVKLGVVGVDIAHDHLVDVADLRACILWAHRAQEEVDITVAPLALLLVEQDALLVQVVVPRLVATITLLSLFRPRRPRLIRPLTVRQIAVVHEVVLDLLVLRRALLGECSAAKRGGLRLAGDVITIDSFSDGHGAAQHSTASREDELRLAHVRDGGPLEALEQAVRERVPARREVVDGVDNRPLRGDVLHTVRNGLRGACRKHGRGQLELRIGRRDERVARRLEGLDQVDVRPGDLRVVARGRELAA